MLHHVTLIWGKNVAPCHLNTFFKGSELGKRPHFCLKAFEECGDVLAADVEYCERCGAKVPELRQKPKG